MRVALWPDEDGSELAAEVDGMMADPNQVIFVAERPGGGLRGMVEAGVRPFAKCGGEQAVAFVEGRVGEADVGRAGNGRALNGRVGQWGPERRFHQPGSGALLENGVKYPAQLAYRLEARERVITFRKLLD